MKNLLFAVAAIFTMSFASTASADNFKNNTFSVSAVSGALGFTLDGNKDGLTEAEVSAGVLAYSIGSFDTDVSVAFKYNLDSNTIGLRGEYGIGTEIANGFAMYGVAAVEYATTAGDLGTGDFLLDPTLGVAYHVTDRVSMFGEVGYTWDMSNSFNKLGGSAEVGVVFLATDAVSIIPSISREFDTGNNDYNLNIGVVFAF